MIMQDQNVKIDQSVAVINGVTYPIRAISSIQIIHERMTAKRKRALVVALAGVVFLFFAQGDITALGGGAFLAAVGALMFFFAKDNFYLKLVTNGGERKVLESNDGAYLAGIRDSLVKAVSMDAV